MGTAEFFNEIAISATSNWPCRRRGVGKPGEFFNSLSEQTKERLKGLKSDDLNRLRLDEVLPMIPPTDRQCMSDLLLEFDSKVAKVRSGIRYQENIL